METIRIPVITGDGTGEDIWNASREIFEEALSKSTGNTKRIEWIPVIAGLRALEHKDHLLPAETVDAITECSIALKGPLTTPVGGGFRSVNVYLRQMFDLYVCMRPIRWFKGLPSPLKSPEVVDIIIFRENTEDLYRGIEWRAGTDDARTVINFLKDKMGVDLALDNGIGIKPISRSGTHRFVKWSIDTAIRMGRKVITIVHKGNIMKYTEGAFREWAYDTAGAYKELSTECVSDRIEINDRIADNMFMQVISRPGDYDVLLCPNLNGDYLSDACAALIGGLGVAPGANFGDNVAIFEPTHGSAPKYACKDVVNPTSFILSGAMLFDHIGLERTAETIRRGVERTIQEGVVTYDLARQIEGVKPVRCSEFGAAVLKRL
ncbi:MAG: isocitrate/isopropylmalate family dehydrogenase [Syntrophorhabdaceae bacterium]|nr:isocitrate/isopropylmalate family dehydrogenase [Syntrophorhabdaceae bacterium]MDD4195798.1 isocitrate/isopropylmalate family dehydrogenase [Syntrophorhabdaceae bacterium]